jgi:hypothetical protein
MPTKHQGKRPADAEDDAHEQRSAAIAGRVLHALGQSEVLRRVNVRHLWDGHYRVNVLIGEDPASVRITHSFFLVTDGDGAILASTPEITRQT